MVPAGEDSKFDLVCLNHQGPIIGEANQGTHMHYDEKWADLGPNLDLIFRGYEKNDPSSPIEE
jgi:hypothetical protein